MYEPPELRFHTVFALRERYGVPVCPPRSRCPQLLKCVASAPETVQRMCFAIIKAKVTACAHQARRADPVASRHLTKRWRHTLQMVRLFALSARYNRFRMPLANATIAARRRALLCIRYGWQRALRFCIVTICFADSQLLNKRFKRFHKACICRLQHTHTFRCIFHIVAEPLCHVCPRIRPTHSNSTFKCIQINRSMT